MGRRSRGIRAGKAEDSNRHGAATKPVQHVAEFGPVRAFSLCGQRDRASLTHPPDELLP